MHFQSKDATRLTGVPPHVLHDWDAKGIFKPMKSGGAGKGKAGYRAYSFEDLVALKVAATLRETFGASIEVVKQVAGHMQKLKGLRGRKVGQDQMFVSYKRIPRFVVWAEGRTWDVNDLAELNVDALFFPVILVPIWPIVAQLFFLVELDRKTPADRLPWIEKQAEGETPVALHAARFLAGLDTYQDAPEEGLQMVDQMLELGIPLSAILRRWRTRMAQ
jgi:DNA-binding transcriptional MerR regulator